MEYLNKGEWDHEFVEQVKIYASMFKDWVQINPILKNLFYQKHFFFPVKDWINPDNDLEILLVNLTIQEFFKEYGVQSDRNIFKSVHIYTIVVHCSIQVMQHLWGNIIQKSNFDTSGYIDHLIRSKLIVPPGYGIGFLSLMIASQVELTHNMLMQIETSRDMTPNLNFLPNDLIILNKICRTEQRLRLALCIAQELGHISDKLNVVINTYQFEECMWNIFWRMNEYNERIKAGLKTDPHYVQFFLLSECIKYYRLKPVHTVQLSLASVYQLNQAGFNFNNI